MRVAVARPPPTARLKDFCSCLASITLQNKLPGDLSVLKRKIAEQPGTPQWEFTALPKSSCCVAVLSPSPRPHPHYGPFGPQTAKLHWPLGLFQQLTHCRYCIEMAGRISLLVGTVATSYFWYMLHYALKEFENLQNMCTLLRSPSRSPIFTAASVVNWVCQSQVYHTAATACDFWFSMLQMLCSPYVTTEILVHIV